MTINSDALVPAETLEYLKTYSGILVSAYSNAAANFAEGLTEAPDSIPFQSEFDELAKIANGARAGRDLAYYGADEDLTVGKLAQLCVDKIRTLSLDGDNYGAQIYATVLGRIL